MSEAIGGGTTAANPALGVAKPVGAGFGAPADGAHPGRPEAFAAMLARAEGTASRPAGPSRGADAGKAGGATDGAEAREASIDANAHASIVLRLLGDRGGENGRHAHHGSESPAQTEAADATEDGAGGAVSDAAISDRTEGRIPPSPTFGVTPSGAQMGAAPRVEPSSPGPEEDAGSGSAIAEATESEWSGGSAGAHSPAGASAGQRVAVAPATPAAADGIIRGTRRTGAEIAGSASDTGKSQSAGRGPQGVGGVDPFRIEKDLALLHPEFRVRVERVVTRMAEEHGHEVEVVETLRQQARQNYLYEQGRTRQGEVVTWTRNSNHSRGMAADVIIDGSYDNPAAYARLQRIAAQEGLRTLGPKDPGHLELPAPKAAGSSEPRVAGAGANGLVAHAALPANASPTTAARGATIHRVAVSVAPAPVAPVAAVAAAPAVAAARAATVAVPGAAPQRRSPAAADAPVTTESASPAPDGPRIGTPAFALHDLPRFDLPDAQASTTLTSAAAERIAHLLDLRDGAASRPISQMLLRIDGPEGEDRIRLDLRGTAVGATIDVADQAAADRLTGRIGELQRALEQRGLEAESLRVRTTARPEVTEVPKVVGTVADSETIRSTSGRNPGDQPGHRERSAGTPGDEARQGSQDARNRSRKEPKGGKTA